MKKAMTSVFFGLLTGVLCSQGFSDAYWGVDFEIPEGWVHQKEEGVVIMGHNTIPGLIVVLQHQVNTLEELRMEAEGGLSDQQTYYLIPSGNPVNFGDNGLAADFTGVIEGQQVRSHIISLLSPYGGGITIMVAAQPGLFKEDHREAVKLIANTAAFSAPVEPPVIDEWRKKLANSRLTYMISNYSSDYDGGGSGYSTTRTIDLCAEGYFRYQSDSDFSVSTGDGYGGFGADGNQGQGSWSVQSRSGFPYLVLSFSNGEYYEYRLHEEDGKTYLDGERYFYTNSDSAAEYRPNCW